MLQTIFDAAVKAIAAKTPVHPEAVKAVYHYFFGGGKDRTLPEECHKETKKAIKEYLRWQWSFPTWKINVAKVDGWEFINDLTGVVGAFNFDIECVEEEGVVRFHCWDLWNFNAWTGAAHKEDFSFGISVPSTKADKLIKSAASAMGIAVKEASNELLVSEHELAKLNEGRQFYTRWTIEFTLEELREINKDFSFDAYDWKHGGLPKKWMKQLAFVGALEKALPPKKALIQRSRGDWESVEVISSTKNTVKVQVPVDWSLIPNIVAQVEAWDE